MSQLLPEGIILLPQEIPLTDPQSCNCFCPSPAKPFTATPGALDTFGLATIAACLLYLQRQAQIHHGLDYLQVFENVTTKQRLWFIEDGEGGCINALLPEDY